METIDPDAKSRTLMTPTENGPDEKLLQLLVSQLQEFVVVLTDEAGFFKSWHPGVEQVFGYRAEEFVGRHIKLLFLPGDVQSGAPERELEKARQQGRASDTCWLVRKDGTPIFVEGVTLGLRSAEGVPVGFGKILRDVSDRKNSDDRLRTFSRALDQSAVIVRSWNGIIRHWTAGCERLYGWTAGEAVGQICQQLLQTQFSTPLDQIQAQLEQQGSWQGDLGHRHRDGSQLGISALWIAMRGDDAEGDLVIETQTDITDRERMRQELEGAHEQLKRVRDDLQRSNEELEEFARIASHDLGAPITSARWLVDAFRKRYSDRLDAEGRECMEQIGRGLTRMSDLVEGVLAHARAGGAIVPETESDAGEAFSIALENLQSEIKGSAASISHGFFPEVGMAPQALAQLFQNLLSNAIKYRRSLVQLVIEVQVLRQDGMWCFSISDNGKGIEPEWFDRIFQPMQRLADSEIPGSGIGLATCRKIVRRAGGTIWVESKYGAGSTFHFTLPVLPHGSSVKTRITPVQ